MNSDAKRLSLLGRRAAELQDWAAVETWAERLLRLDDADPEGHFLAGLVQKAAQRPVKAVKEFERALELDPSRYDAAIELASQHSMARRNAVAADLIAWYESSLANSPRYLDMAGTVYTEIGLAEKAWPLYRKANALQPDVDLFAANLAACGVYLGKIAEAREIYTTLLGKNPNHQRNHYHLARLAAAKDDTHIEQMKAALRSTNLPDDKNVFIYYAIGKELEDLGRWSEAFSYYRKAGDAVTSVARYDIDADLALIGKIIEVCNREWLNRRSQKEAAVHRNKTPVFIVGLPRTGTTLAERILSSHSQVESLGETQFMQMAIRRVSGVPSVEPMNVAMIEEAAGKDISLIATAYLDAVAYRLGEKPMFIDKLPYNFLFLGFIAKAFPHARIVHLRRHPLDSCFAMYKQVFTWAYKFSYTLEGLGRYYAAHEGLRSHWKEVLGERMVELEYETLVSDQEAQIRSLLAKLGLEFEEDCLNFDKNRAVSTTASSVQIREKMHTRSVNRWRHFAEELKPLRSSLMRHGVRIE
ncbi:MAG: tetratricopeptide repeat-containing sulfotransferase family protein [Kiloniellales bacterium]